MDLDYFKDHICEELEGAKDYIMRAIEVKGMDATWSRTFYNMSLQESEHAKQLLKFFEDYVKIIDSNIATRPEYVNEAMEYVIDEFTSRMSEITILQNIYKE